MSSNLVAMASNYHRQHLRARSPGVVACTSTMPDMRSPGRLGTEEGGQMRGVDGGHSVGLQPNYIGTSIWFMFSMIVIYKYSVKVC